MLKLALKLAQKFGLTFIDVKILEKLKGYKTIALNAIVMLIGAVTIFANDIVKAFADKACEMGLPQLCNIESTTFFGYLLAAIGFLNFVLRTITDLPIPTLDSTLNKKPNE